MEILTLTDYIILYGLGYCLVFIAWAVYFLRDGEQTNEQVTAIGFGAFVMGMFWPLVITVAILVVPLLAVALVIKSALSKTKFAPGR